ncbi:MAG: hypothetical protein IPN51_17585 [Chloracidobacterium sp.]|nr:hypothetical protein [Chloracidobacterium sp.]
MTSILRKIAVVSYKSSRQFAQRFGRNPNRNGEDPHTRTHDRFDIGGYLDHHGKGFRERFEIESYDLIFRKAMDLFDLSVTIFRGIRANVARRHFERLAIPRVRSLRVGPGELSKCGVNAGYYEIDSDDGHDAFLSGCCGDVARAAPYLEGQKFVSKLLTRNKCGFGVCRQL